MIKELEKKLLYYLSKNARFSLQELAKRVGTSVDVVRYRMKKFEQRNIILEYIAVVNIQKLGYTEYIILLDLHNIDAQLLNKLRLYLIEHGNIKYCFLGGISPQIFILSAFASAEDLTTFLKSVKSEFRSIIALANYLLIKEHKKFSLFPKFY